MDVAPVTPDDRRAPPPMGWHALPPESAMSALQTEAARGLSEAAAAARLQSDGPNDPARPADRAPRRHLPASVPQPARVCPAGRGSAFPRPQAPDGCRLHRLRAGRERLARRVAGAAGGTAECEPAGPAARAGNGPARRRLARNRRIATRARRHRCARKRRPRARRPAPVRSAGAGGGCVHAHRRIGARCARCRTRLRGNARRLPIAPTAHLPARSSCAAGRRAWSSPPAPRPKWDASRAG